MPENKPEMIRRIRRQADSTEDKARRLIRTSVSFAGSTLYDKIVRDAESLLAEALALRQHADGLELE